jgi:NitT/TauT family transport system ATP-binding protein
VALINLVGVSRTFQTRNHAVPALEDINLQVAPGQFVAVIGRSGCGKSTLLRLIAGLLAPTAGRVLVADEPVTGPRRDIALMFQQPALLPWRTVLSNVLLPVEIFGWSRAVHHQRALELLDLVGLSAFRTRLPHELSGGMQQRVALCRALIQRPRVMLMDEPFSALDALTRQEIAVELQRIHKEQAATTVLVTHSIQEAVLLADRIVVLTPHPGRVHRVLDIDIPQPRSLGFNAHLSDIATVTAELHDLLLRTGREQEVPAPTQPPAPRHAPSPRIG